MKEIRLSGRPKAKVSRLRHPGTLRAQACKRKQTSPVFNGLNVIIDWVHVRQKFLLLQTGTPVSLKSTLVSLVNNVPVSLKNSALASLNSTLLSLNSALLSLNSAPASLNSVLVCLNNVLVSLCTVSSQ